MGSFSFQDTGVVYLTEEKKQRFMSLNKFVKTLKFFGWAIKHQPHINLTLKVICKVHSVWYEVYSTKCTV